MRDVLARKIMILLAAFMIAVSMPALAQKLETFEPDKLEAFVIAAIKIEMLVAQRQPQIDTAETLAQANAIADAAVDEIASIIDETPRITLPEYRVISKAVKEDPALHQRVNDIAKQLEERQPQWFRAPPST